MNKYHVMINSVATPPPNRENTFVLKQIDALFYYSNNIGGQSNNTRYSWWRKGFLAM